MLLNILSKGGRTMNNFLNKLERKWGRYAVPNLIMYLLGGYAVGFVLFYLAPDVLNLLALEPARANLAPCYLADYAAGC